MPQPFEQRVINTFMTSLPDDRSLFWKDEDPPPLLPLPSISSSRAVNNPNELLPKAPAFLGGSDPFLSLRLAKGFK